MKNANIGLLILSLFMFQLLESKQQNNNQKSKKSKTLKTAKPAKSTAKRRVVVATPVQDVVREEETHTVQETVRPLERNEYVAPSVQTRYEQEEDGDLKETVTTVEVKDNQVITKTESWTLKDYAKAAAIGAGVLGAGALAYYNQDAISQGASDLYSKGQGLFNDASNWFGNLTGSEQKEVADQAVTNQENIVKEAVLEGNPSDIAQAQANLDEVKNIQERINNGESVTEEDLSLLQQVIQNRNVQLIGGGLVAGTSLYAASRTGSGKQIIESSLGKVRTGRTAFNNKFGKKLTPEAQAQQVADDLAVQQAQASYYPKNAREFSANEVAQEKAVNDAINARMQARHGNVKPVENVKPANVSEAIDQAAAKFEATTAEAAAPSYMDRIRNWGNEARQTVSSKVSSFRQPKVEAEAAPLTEYEKMAEVAANRSGYRGAQGQVRNSTNSARINAQQAANIRHAETAINSGAKAQLSDMQNAQLAGAGLGSAGAIGGGFAYMNNPNQQPMNIQESMDNSADASVLLGLDN